MNLSLTRRSKRKVLDEPIEVKERRHSFMPQAFMWHGHCYRVHAVERCWTVLKRRRSEGRLCFLVRCAEGMFEVHQDLLTNTWHLRTAQWHQKQNAK